MRTITTLTAALAALTLTIGCGDTGGGGSAATPTAAQSKSTQQSEAATDASNQTVNAANESIVDAGSGGAVAAKGVPSASRSAASFNFQANVNLTIDLDDVDAQGQDRWPNATGQLNIIAAGSVTGTANAGNAAYDVETKWLTEGVFTDPVSGVVAKMAAGSGLEYSLSVQWSYTDDFNWSISASSDLSGQHTVTVIDDGVTYVATASGSRHVEVAFTRTPTSFLIVFAVTGNRTVTVTNGVETHVVTVNMLGLDNITITVDGVVFGPYTALQIHQYFHCHID
ncbi:MAG TPA: hypothetical protein VF950_04420 [Planctomycetota bacterium]